MYYNIYTHTHYNITYYIILNYSIFDYNILHYIISYYSIISYYIIYIIIFLYTLYMYSFIPVYIYTHTHSSLIRFGDPTEEEPFFHHSGPSLQPL